MAHEQEIEVRLRLKKPMWLRVKKMANKNYTSMGWIIELILRDWFQKNEKAEIGEDDE